MIFLLIPLVYFIGIFCTAIYCRYHNVNDYGDTSIQGPILVFWPIVVPVWAVCRVGYEIFLVCSKLIDVIVSALKTPPSARVQRTELGSAVVITEPMVKYERPNSPSLIRKVVDAVIRWDRKLKGLE